MSGPVKGPKGDSSVEGPEPALAFDGEGADSAKSALQVKASRGERQRARILDAAESCFIERGFHAASMASIAATAGISPGLIYRYFSAKNEIVQAIIERHLETEGCQAMRRVHKPEDFCNEALEMFERWKRRDNPSMNAALFLELNAEATRDPEIAQIVRNKDRTVSDDLAKVVQRVASEQGVHLTHAAAHARAVLLHCLVEGLACRAVRDPTLHARTLRPLLGKLIAAVLS